MNSGTVNSGCERSRAARLCSASSSSALGVPATPFPRGRARSAIVTGAPRRSSGGTIIDSTMCCPMCCPMCALNNAMP